MGAQDRTEKVLRDIHVLFSKAEPFENSKKKVVVDKGEMMELLNELNGCIYDIMEEHELTKQSRDKANREAQKQGDEIIFAASRKAEDIYAASVMYTDNALNSIQDIMKDATETIAKLNTGMQDRLKAEQQVVKDNQFELKAQLQNLIDTQKYLHLIEDENRRLAKAKVEGREELPKETSYAAVKPEIRVNKEYFAQAGIPLDEDSMEDSQTEADLEKAVASEDLDKEYFQWKEGDEEPREKKDKGFSIFGKLF